MRKTPGIDLNLTMDSLSGGWTAARRSVAKTAQDAAVNAARNADSVHPTLASSAGGKRSLRGILVRLRIVISKRDGAPVRDGRSSRLAANTDDGRGTKG